MSFRLKTILGIAAIEAVLLAILVWSGLRFIETTAEQEFTQRAQATVRAFAVTTKDPLIGSDLATLQSFVWETLNYPGVIFARVRDADGRVLASAGDEAALARPFAPDADLGAVTDGVFRAAEEIAEGGLAFGRVELALSVQALKEIQADARRYGIGLALLEMGLVALFSLALGVYLTRQLLNLTEGSRRVAAGELGYQVPVKGRDELAATARAFNLMSARVRESYADLAEREERLRQVLENIQDGILTLEPGGRIQSFSPAAEAIFGRPAATVVGDTARPLFTEGGWATVQALFGETPDPRRLGLLLDTEGRRADGQAFPLEIRVTPVGQGPEQGLIAVVRDLSARAAAEAELRLRNRIIEDSVNGVVIADATQPDLPVVYVNQGFTRITGYGAEEVVGRNCRFLQGPATEADALERIRAALREPTDVNVVLRNYAKDGREFWNDLSITPIHDGRGRLTHFVALQNDITERMRAQEELAAREAYLRRVLNSTHDAIIVIDAEGRVESFNAGAEAMFGYRAEEIIGQNVSVLAPSPHREQHDDYLRRHRETGVSRILGVEREFEAQRRDGSAFPMTLRVNEMNEAGRRRYLGVIHDITERKRVENALREAKEAAEEAADTKTQFLANMSHEIRTPMHGVLGALEMLRDTPLSAPQQRYLDTANTSADILLSLIDEVLDFSRLEVGKLRIESLDFELRRTVEDVTAMLGQRAHAKRLELACFIAPTVPDRLRGDPIRLRQILTNLLGNAIKFTEHGEVVVSVTVEQLEAARVVLRFEVRDTGIGIAADKQPLLFQPFVQADGGTSRRFGGTGLGLSIARRLAELMGGEIGLESAPKVGSRFWFRLPFLVAGRGGSGVRADFSGARMLVVDDNATNRIILHRYLTAWGVQPGSAGSGEEALAKLQDAAAAGRPYQLVLLDFNMPGMDGLMLAKRLRQDPALAATRLLMLSSSSREPAIIDELGIDIWLDKPVRQSDLHDAIATILNRDDSRALAAEPRSLRPGTELRFAGERVLLVEDNLTTQQLGEALLRQRGLEVDIVGNGREAIAALEREQYAIVLMDVQMPELDGFEATRRIRAREAAEGRARTPIVALTAHALPADREKCLDAGMDDYLVKPYSGAALSAIVARWLTPPNGVGADAPAAFAPVLDPVKLAEVRALMGTGFAALLATFASTVREQLALALQALDAQDGEALLDAAHRLKNTAGDIGAPRLHGEAAALENALKRGSFPAQGIGALERAGREAVAAAEQLPERESPS
ncbi:MAG: PAS domain S-box protein [Candidatus Competibacteraceae bacterium]|nr:MAG: PAS domain S-box protein [Candidatus Competibacteraceae bacterium]